MKVRLTVFASLLVSLALVLGTATIAAGSSTSKSHPGFRVVRPKHRHNGRPADPPIGVTIQTLSGDPAGAVQIDDKPQKDTYDRNGIFVVVLDRKTRAVLESGTVPRNKAGLDQLHSIEQKNVGTDGALMIVSGTHGVPNDQVNSLDSLVTDLGGTALTAADKARLADDSAFSIIGIPGGAAGGAWTRVAQQFAGGGGEISGWLQFNPVIGMYNYVPGDDVSFNTAAASTPANAATIEVNGRRYFTQLDSGQANGFMILTLNAQTLDYISEVAVTTDTAAGQSDLKDALAHALRPFADPNNSPRLVFVRSIGQPKLDAGSWPQATDAIVKLGGTALAINNLDGKSDYALIGASGSSAAVEAGAVLGQPGLPEGLLARGHDMAYHPVDSGPAGSVNLELAKIEYQGRQAFPPFSDEQKKAETYIGKKIDLCADSATVCNFRTEYSDNYQADWRQFATDLNTDRVKEYPGPGHGFDAAQYSAVRSTLETEISMVNKIHNYFAYLQNLFEKAGGDRGINVEAVGKAIFDSVNPPPDRYTTSQTLALLGKISSIGGSPDRRSAPWLPASPGRWGSAPTSPISREGRCWPTRSRCGPMSWPGS